MYCFKVCSTLPIVWALKFQTPLGEATMGWPHPAALGFFDCDDAAVLPRLRVGRCKPGACWLQRPLVYASSWIQRHEPAALLNSQPMGFYSAR